MLVLYRAEYEALLQELALTYVGQGHMLEDLQVLQEVSMQMGGTNATDEVVGWMKLRIGFLSQQVRAENDLRLRS